MPADITAPNPREDKAAAPSVREGTDFRTFLADEINRTPPKTQAALLEAMQEYHVTAAGRTYPLDRPFFVLATQNPIELEGTYPLPEAQLDRFMFNIVITYLTEDDEVRVVTQTTGGDGLAPARVLTGADILYFQELARQVVIAEEIARYAVRLVDASRPGRAGTPDFIEKWVKWGAAARVAGARPRRKGARLMHDRYHVAIKDIQAWQNDPAAPDLTTSTPSPSASRGHCRAADRDVPVPRAECRDGPQRAGTPVPRPMVVARLGTLELRPGRSSKDFSGLHRSPFKGFSVEFAEYRQYIPATTCRHDWRSTRAAIAIRQAVRGGNNLDCHVMLDISASMGYGSGGMTKHQYSQCLAASLGYLMNRQRDRVGLTAFDDRTVDTLPASARPGHLRALLLTLDRLRLGRKTNVSKPLHQLADSLSSGHGHSDFRPLDNPRV